MALCQRVLFVEKTCPETIVWSIPEKTDIILKSHGIHGKNFVFECLYFIKMGMLYAFKKMYIIIPI